MTARAILLLALATTALSACGSRQPLRPAPGMTAVPTAAAASAPESADSLMTPDAQARPARNTELLTRSRARADDPFDLPPGGAPAPAPAKPVTDDK